MKPMTRAIARNLGMVVLAVLLTLSSSAITALGGEPDNQGLFAASAVGDSIDRAGDPTVIRSRYVDLNLGLLFDEDGAPRELAGNPLVLNFFEDTALVVVLDRVEPAYGGGFTWAGRVLDEPLSLVTLAVNDGVMAGTVLMPGAVFEIGYAANGVHAVAEIDQSAFPPDADPLVPDLSAVGTPGVAADAVPAALADDGSIIDVMVVYTQLARSEAGGTTQMLNLINDAINQTNSTYANSQINQRLRLVHAAEVSYTESGIDVDLTRLRNNGDGYMDIVHTWRNTYGADEVALIVEYPYLYPYCGIAYLMDSLTTGFESYAFATIERECVTGNLSFAHELGHNMGAHHDWYVNSSTDLFTYSHGKVNVYDRWYTIMSYYSECSDRGVYCYRVPYWSNPNVLYGGEPMGVPGGTSTACWEGQWDPPCDADNHRTLNESAWTVANFRQSVVDNPPDAPTSLSATPVLMWKINLSWTDNSNDENGFRIERKVGSGSWLPIATVGANSTSYSDTSATPGTLYYYRVIAFNTYGDSDPSNTASATLPEVAGPLVYNGYVIDDDNSGGTSGNDNGLAECGETVDLTVMLWNAGNTEVEGIGSELTPVGGTGLDYIDNISNTESDYPDIAGGASEGNLLAFGFSVKPMEDFAHWIDFELEITADNWSGGTVEFNLPFVCKANAGYRFYMPVVSKD